MSALNYSKKQMQPLIAKYAIDAEKNTAFHRIIEMFDGQPNYQLWGVKIVFSKVIKPERLEEIKDFIDYYPQCIKELSKNGNLISYTSKEDLLNLLPTEIEGLKRICFVKHMISIFNTNQRKILTDGIIPSDLNSISWQKKNVFNDWYDLFTKFNKLSGNTKSKVIHRMSAVHELSELKKQLNDALAEKYAWNRDDLLAFAAANTPAADVIVADKDVVVLQVKSYADSHALCYGRTNWCITSSESQWKSYVDSKSGNKQYFFFDFTKPEKDELAYIGFTVNDKTGFYAAHSTHDSSLMNNGITYHGKHVNIQKALVNAKVPLGIFLKLKENKAYKWDADSIRTLAKNKSEEFAIAYDKNNRIIINVLQNSGLQKLLGHTFIKYNDMSISQDSKFYVLFDFNYERNLDKSIVALYYKKDQYKIDSLNTIVDVFGTNLKDDNYMNSIGIKTEDYLNREKINPSILLHKLIDEGDVEGACSLLDNPEVDINYVFNDRRPVFSAIDSKMHKVVGKIIANDKFDCNVDDGLGQSLIQNLMYTFYLDATNKLTKDNEKAVHEMVEAIIDSGRFDLNYIDDNDDTAINIAATHESMNWIVEKLAAMPNVNVNVRNDIDCTALGNAIRKGNLGAVEILGRRPDLEVSEYDRKLAAKYKVDLDKYLKPQPFAKTEEIKVTKEEVVAEQSDADKYDEIFKKVFSSIS